jgi:hypothetical protein
MRAGVRDACETAAPMLAGLVRQKLSGAVLRPRSGALRASIRAETAEDANGIEARVFGDGALPYARIQEYGGRISVPEIRPMNAQALAFAYGGRLVFARHARAHVVTIPERSYMRSSLAEFAPVFAAMIGKVANGAAT